MYEESNEITREAICTHLNQMLFLVPCRWQDEEVNGYLPKKREKYMFSAIRNNICIINYYVMVSCVRIVLPLAENSDQILKWINFNTFPLKELHILSIFVKFKISNVLFKHCSGWQTISIPHTNSKAARFYNNEPQNASLPLVWLHHSLYAVTKVLESLQWNTALWNTNNS